MLASTPGLALLLVTSACFGLAAGAINPVLGAVQLERVPPAARARVSGVVGAGAWAAMPLGAVVTGFAVEAVGVRTVVLVVGCAYLLVTLLPLTGRAWRGMDRPVPVPGGVPG